MLKVKDTTPKQRGTVQRVYAEYTDVRDQTTSLQIDLHEVRALARALGFTLVEMPALAKLETNYRNQGDDSYELIADGVGRAISLIQTREARPAQPCDHPWHNNPGLITPCPSCKEEV